MSCERYEAKLPDLVRGHLDGAEAMAVEEHIASCLSCAQLRDLIIVVNYNVIIS